MNDNAVTGLDKKETGKTIAEKIPAAYKEFLNVGNKYYALPLFETSINLNYDIDLFKQKCLYFAAGFQAEKQKSDKRGQCVLRKYSCVALIAVYRFLRRGQL